MIHRERVADDVYTFQSDVYAQVNAGAVIGQDWAVVIDTLAFPDETLAIREFIEEELKRKVRYVINTHYHADHSWGNCFFPGAYVFSHALCRDLLENFGQKSLDAAQEVECFTDALAGFFQLSVHGQVSTHPQRTGGITFALGIGGNLRTFQYHPIRGIARQHFGDRFCHFPVHRQADFQPTCLVTHVSLFQSG